MNMWHNYMYKELDARYNFSLGPSVIALSTTEQLVELAKLDPPYLQEYGQLEVAASDKLDLSGQPKIVITVQCLELSIFLFSNTTGRVL